jgi:hypothetical protein
VVRYGAHTPHSGEVVPLTMRQGLVTIYIQLKWLKLVIISVCLVAQTVGIQIVAAVCFTMVSCSGVKREQELAHMAPTIETDLAEDLMVLHIDPDLQKLLDNFYANINKDSEPAIIGAKCVYGFFEEDVEFLKKLREGATNPSAGVNPWAQKGLDMFTKSKG